jgi:hypothetical protein
MMTTGKTGGHIYMDELTLEQDLSQFNRRLICSDCRSIGIPDPIHLLELVYHTYTRKT